MPPCASDPHQVNTGILSMPALLEEGHGILHFQEKFQDHTNKMKRKGKNQWSEGEWQ